MRRICPACRVNYEDFHRDFMCPHEPRVGLKCRFCASPWAARCSWPSADFIRATYREIKEGDRVRRSTESASLAARPSAIVRSIEPLAFEGFSDDLIIIVLQIGTKGKEITVRKDSPVRVLRPQPCGLPVCESHLRRVWDGVEYCAEHWHAWQAVA